MQEYDYSKLRGKIKEKYENEYNFAKALGISSHTISVKLNNLVDFKQKEINKICDLLGIPEAQIRKYFFTKKTQ